MTPNTPEPTDRIGDEHRFVERLRSGDERAFEELVRTYGGRLLAVARRMLGDEAEARDAVQDAMLSCVRSLKNFREGSTLSTWLHRITVNASLMRQRAARRRPEIGIDDLLPSFHEDGHRVDPGPAWQESALEQLDRKQIRELVLGKIRQLPESYRNVLLLRDIEQLDTETASRMLGLEPGAVRVRLHRARQALRTSLDPHFRSRSA